MEEKKLLEQLLEIREKTGEKKQVSDLLYCTLKEAIATATLPSGYRMKEEELADWFDVSRTPVREAIKRLEIEGFVTSDHLRGSIVRQFELDECLDTLEVLEWLRNIAIDFLDSRIPRSILMQLEANLKKGETLSNQKDQLENNIEFHALLIKATGNSELIKITRRLEFRERAIANNIIQYKYDENYVQHHRDLLKAIIDNDTEYITQYKEQNKNKVNKYMNMLISEFLGP